jgi:hypothetical protein
MPGRAKKSGILRAAAIVAPAFQPMEMTGWKPVPLENEKIGGVACKGIHGTLH